MRSLYESLLDSDNTVMRRNIKRSNDVYQRYVIITILKEMFGIRDDNGPKSDDGSNSPYFVFDKINRRILKKKQLLVLEKLNNLELFDSIYWAERNKNAQSLVCVRKDGTKIDCIFYLDISVLRCSDDKDIDFDWKELLNK